ncbi:hypothetical protein BOX15_Mlig027177g3 [Macrostomum lignano]|uniref:Uncharacterized protein n=1 Tax=Macrostomum lignano TaxID=282301 RepID=A0A267EW18_9PLAT|nr:hypothetical protein BOX15_Mlig027177g2 [Macrostomum lignano]PAA65009.1 hypothetical protein BOX15_Mlig027177g1 [Macrostomum lignano]PAA81627.1 hypothetical protein BOX15_Mlig027177g3 [Macrostomum lignano]
MAKTSSNQPTQLPVALVSLTMLLFIINAGAADAAVNESSQQLKTSWPFCEDQCTEARQPCGMFRCACCPGTECRYAGNRPVCRLPVRPNPIRW